MAQIKRKFIEDQAINSDKVDSTVATTAALNAGVAEAKDYTDAEVNSHINEASDAHDASAISVAASGNLASTTVQAALQELQGDVDGINTAIGSLSFEASAISVTPSGNLASTDVQAALQELQGDLDGIDAAYVNTSGDTVTGSLILDGSLAPVAAEAEIQVKDYLDNTKSSTLDAYSLSSNHEFQVSGATSLSLDAGGGTADITMSGSNVFIGHTPIRDSASSSKKIEFSSSGQAILIDGDGGTTKLKQETLVIENSAGSSTLEVSNTGAIEKATYIRAGNVADGHASVNFQASALVLAGGSGPSPKIEMMSDVDMNSNSIEGLPLPSANGQPLVYDQLGVANGVATLDGSGKISSSQIPAIAITDVYVVANIAARDALTVEEGDVAKVSDAGSGLPRTYIYDGSSWIEIESGSDVASVFGRTGAVSAQAGDYDASQVDYDNATSGMAAADVQAAIDELDGRMDTSESDMSALQDDVGHLVTLSGVAVDSDNLGSFTGSTISDNQTMKAALQDLESAHEAHLNDATDAHDASAISLSPAVNGQSNVQSAMEDHETRIDALEIGGGDTKQVKISANDTTEGYIEDKIVGATNKISISTLNDGGNEDLQITIGSDVFDKSVDGAADVAYNNAASGMAASDVQAAIDELDSRLDNLDASDVPYNNATSLLAATDVQAAIDEVDGYVDDLVSLSGMAAGATHLGPFSGATIGDTASVKQALQDLETAHEAHLNDGDDAHDASAISYSNAGSGMSAADVQDAIDELDSRLDNLDASDVPYSNATSGLTASNVQAAIDELDSHIDNMAAADVSYSGATSGLAALDVQDAIDELDSRLDNLDASDVAYNNATSGLTAIDVQAAVDELASEKYDAANFNSDFDTRLATKSTDNLAEGSNLYFTDARARTAAVANSISDGVSNIAPSQDAVHDALALKLNLLGGVMEGDIDMDNAYTIKNLAAPLDPQDAATKAYVDAVAEGLHVHAPARLLANVDLGGTYNNGSSGVGAYLDFSASPIAVIDGAISFNAGDRIIVAKQNGNSADPENGIYYIAASGDINGSGNITKLTRALDFDTPAEAAGGDFIFISEGSQYGKSGWVSTLSVTTFGTDNVEFLQFSGAGTYSPGDALSLTGGEFDVKFDNSSIGINGSNQLYVKAGGIGNNELAALSVSSGNIQDDAVTADKINSDVAGNGLSQNMMSGALDVNVDDSTIEIDSDILRVKDNGITEMKLQNLSVATAKIQLGAVTAEKINSDVAGNGLSKNMMSGALDVNVDDSTVEIDSDILRVKNSGITEMKLADLSVATGKLQDDAVTAAKINSDVAGNGLSQNMMSGALDVNVDDSTIEIDSDILRVKDSGITEMKLQNLSVATAKIQLGAVTAEKINSDVAGNGLSKNMMSGALDVNVDGSTLEIDSDILRVKDSGITEMKLADLSVATAKLQDDSVTAAKINSDVAGNGLNQNLMSGALDVIVDGSTIEIDTDMLRVKDAGITEMKLADLSVATAKIQDDAVSAAKINSDVAGNGLEQNGVSGALQVKLDGSSLSVSASGLKSNIAWNKESYTITTGDSVLGVDHYFDLDYEIEANSLVGFVDRLAMHEGVDYNLTVVGGVTRVNFIGSLVVPGAEALQNNDKLFFTYQRKLA